MNATSNIAVVVDGVHKVFGGGGAEDVQALSGIDLTVIPGEFVSLIGPSGCGKSTLLRLIGDLLEPTAGTVTVKVSPEGEATEWSSPAKTTVTLTDVVPGALYGDYEALRGASLPTDPNHCFLRSFENLETLLGLYALAPEVESAEPIGLRLPNDADLAEGSTVTLYALGGLATLRPDGEAIPEGAFQAFGTATVVGDVLVSDPGVALPATSVIGWGR